jgi:hypothetical protein
VTVSPAAIELVLDRSGSMATPIPGGTHMTALQSAVSMFSDLVIPDTGFSMGSVQFDDQFAVLTALQNFDATQQNTIKTDANTLTPRGFTSIGGGLKLGQSSMSASSQARKVAIVFTDGFENTPPTIASIEPGVLTAGTEVYAVGLGDPAFLSVAALSELAASSNGKFFQTTDPLVLRKQFVEILSDAFRQNMAADPLLTLQQGVPVTVPVNITNCEGRISFVLLWEDLWVNAGQTPQNLIVQSINGVNVSEIGPAILLPDGRVFAVGGTGHTAIFDPSQPVASAWSNGPDLPADPGNTLAPAGLFTVIDGAACLLPGGQVLFADRKTKAETFSGATSFWSNPTTFFEFDPANFDPTNPGTVAQLTHQPSNNGNDCWTCSLLLLPNGQVQ